MRGRAGAAGGAARAFRDNTGEIVGRLLRAEPALRAGALVTNMCKLAPI